MENAFGFSENAKGRIVNLAHNSLLLEEYLLSEAKRNGYELKKKEEIDGKIFMTLRPIISCEVGDTLYYFVKQEPNNEWIACDFCEEKKEDVSLRADPLLLEVYEESVYHNYCDDCFYNRKDEV